MEILRSYNLSHSFDNNKLFENISFKLKEKETLAIVGVSGSGKSTLLHCLSSFLKPLSGEVYLFGKNIYNIKEKELIHLRRKKIGIIFQFHYLFKGFNVSENLKISTLLSGEKLDYDLLKKFRIDHILDKSVSVISGGEQQRVSIARVLMKKPKIIFADEPTGNLDSKTSNEVMEVIFNYIKENNATLVMVTHDQKLASKCDNTIVLSR